MIRRTALLWLAPVVVLTTGACFATREDVRVLQSDLQVVRAERVASDSALLAAIANVEAGLARISQALIEVADTARSSHATVMRLRGDVREDLQAIRQQLIMIQELTGQSQRRIQELRSEMEARAAELATPSASPPPRDASAPAAAPSAPPPLGPAQLYQLGQDQMSRGSASTARGAFLELLDKHPGSDLAPNALYAIGETWSDEGNGVAADSVYALVVQRYPRSDVAPNALYKRATSFRSIGQTQQARAIYQQIVDRYPGSEAALLAQEFLRNRP